MSLNLLQSFFLINAKNIPKYSFRGFMTVNVSKFREVAMHCGCSPTGFTIFADHFIIFNSNPASKSWLIVKAKGVQKGQSVFKDTNIKITTEDQQNLGAVNGSETFKQKYDKRIKELRVLCKIA